MPSATQSVPSVVSNKRLWAGRIMSGLVVAFMLMDSVMKLLKLPPVIEGMVKVGYSASVIIPLGITLLFCTLVYAIPRTSVLGAILLTGYLGGAVDANVRVGNPVFTQILFPVYVGIFLWAGLYLRDERLRALLPLKS